MLIGFLVYIWYVLQSFSGVLGFFLILWIIAFVAFLFISRGSGFSDFEKDLTTWDQFKESYKKQTGKSDSTTSEMHDFYLGVRQFKGILLNKFFMLLVVLGLIIHVLLPTPKQLLTIVSAPYIVGYIVDVKNDFNEHNTTVDIVQVPRKFVESIGKVDEYLGTVFKETKTKTESKVEPKAEPKIESKIKTDELEKLIQDAVSLAVKKTLEKN